MIIKADETGMDNKSAFTLEFVHVLIYHTLTVS